MRPPRRRAAWPAVALVAALAGGPAACRRGPPDAEAFRVPPDAKDTPAAPCARRDPLRRALFGDLHVHTALSADAWNYDVEVRPRDAYAYAFGEPISLPPNDASGHGTRRVAIDRPLDFAAVTDHAEFLGETVLCADPGSSVYATDGCREIRDATSPIDSPLALKIMNPFPSHDAEVCGADGARCDGATSRAWQEILDAAEEWNDTSAACQRTTFIGYEYSSHRLGSNLHRNVIFRNRIVPRRPISYLDVQREWQLWALLRDTCLESGTGCDVLAIPHNSNLSNGRMFATDYPGAASEAAQADRARLRAALEPVVEVMQHKGDSECRADLPSVLGSADELCRFEKFENMTARRAGKQEPGACYDGPFADSMPHLLPCLSERSYVRYALVAGLGEEARLGVNPFKLGLIASTDTHNGLAGGVEERSWPGHLGVADAAPERRLSDEPGVMGNVSNNPGGLVGVWAEENSREAIFGALRRREVFGTSGPRIQPRFFGGWDLPADLCRDPAPTARADRLAVPMGADLPPRAPDAAAAPDFAVWAFRDPGTASAPGNRLQRIQIVKGWLDDAGATHQQVVDVAGGENGADVDPATCSPRGPGADYLCGVWRDPDFDPGRRAVYYARVVENPSCRYSAWQCLALAPSERPAGCSSDVVQPVQQERAWTSPIWYTPAAAP